MNILKEQILLEKISKNGFSVSFINTIPDEINLITKSWFNNNVINNGNKILNLELFISLWKESENDFKNIEYKSLRKKEYPSIEDQLDMLYKDNINGTSNWKDLITSIKNKYPKN